MISLSQIYRQAAGTLVFAFIVAVGLAASADELATAKKLYAEKQYPEAQVAFAAIVQGDPDNAEAAYYLGRLASRRHEFDRAIAWFEKATTLDPHNSGYFAELGGAYGDAADEAAMFSKKNLAKKCLAALEQAVALDPGNLEARNGLVTFYKRAPRFVGGGMDKAYLQAEEIRRLDPVRGAIVLSDLYLGEKKFAQAYQVCEATCHEHPEAKTLFFQLGRVCAATGQHLERGEAALKEYLQCAPKENEPGLHAAHWQLGAIYEKQGKRDDARQEYAAALQIKPDFAAAQQALAKLAASKAE